MLFREVEENGDAIMRQQGRTLQSQLTKSDNEEGVKALNGRNDANLVKVSANLLQKSTVLRNFTMVVFQL